MSPIVKVPSINFRSLQDKVDDGRFTSKKIARFAQERIKELIEEHEAIERNFQEFQEGNEASRLLVLKRIEEISKKCSENYPTSTKVRQLDELKTLLAPINIQYNSFGDLLTKEERVQEEADKHFTSSCGMKKSQLLRNEQEEYEKSLLFQAYLKKVNNKFNESPWETIYFAYAWPTDSRYEQESWVQPFLKNLQAHLKKGGFPTVQLDIVNNRYGANMYQFMEKAKTSGYVLLFGTESLLDKFSKGISAVCTELIHILRKREEDGKENVHRVFPILLSGEHRSAFPPEYERFSTIRDWRDHSYLHNFQQLFLELLNLSPEDYQPKLRRYWDEVCSERTDENPPDSDWYLRQREAIDKCERNNDLRGLHAIEVSRVIAPPSRAPSPHPTFLERLKKHYLTRSTISVLTFREKGRWENTIPIDSLYTKLIIIPEKIRKKLRRTLSVDEAPFKAPTEALFNTKNEVPPEKIFDLAKNNRVIIYGSAGIGKTAFVSMLLYKWARGKIFSDFQTVFSIRLRNLTSSFYPNTPGKTYRAIDILQKEYPTLGFGPNFTFDPESTLLILEEWDRRPSETWNGHLKNAFQEIQDYPNILVTSRPGSIDLDATEFEILGFTHPQIKFFIQNYFGDRLGEGEMESIMEFVSKNRLIRSLAHIPFNLTVICALFEQDKTLINGNSPLTVSALYDRMINQFYKSFLKEEGVRPEELRTMKLPSRYPSVRKLTSCLEEIAFKAVERETIYTDGKSLEDTAYSMELDIEMIKNLGLYKVEDSQGSFIHSTFQEYFAASYIASLYKDSQTRPSAKKIVRSQESNLRFSRILPMIAGILSGSDEKALEVYLTDLQEAQDTFNDPYKLSLIVRCFGECENPTFLPYYNELINNVINTGSLPIHHVINPILSGNHRLFNENNFIQIINDLLERVTVRLQLLRALETCCASTHSLPNEILHKIATLIEEKRLDSPHVAIKIFGHVGGPQAMEILLSFFLDSTLDQYVRFSAARALEEVISREKKVEKMALQDFLKILLSPIETPETRSSAADLLGVASHFGANLEEEIEALTTILLSPVSKEVSHSVAKAFGKIAKRGKKIGERGIKALVSLVLPNETDENTYCTSVKSLGRIAEQGEVIEEDVVSALIQRLKKKISPKMYSTITKALIRMADANVGFSQKHLEDLLEMPLNLINKSPSPFEVLGHILAAGKTSDSAPILKKLFSILSNSDEKEELRCSCLRALKVIASTSEQRREMLSSRILLLLDNSEDSYIRIATIHALGEITVAREQVNESEVSRLIDLLSSPKEDETVRTSAGEVLVKISSSVGDLGGDNTDTLITLLRNSDENWYFRYTYAAILGKLAVKMGTLTEEKLEILLARFSSTVRYKGSLDQLANTIIIKLPDNMSVNS